MVDHAQTQRLLPHLTLPLLAEFTLTIAELLDLLDPLDIVHKHWEEKLNICLSVVTY